VQGR